MANPWFRIYNSVLDDPKLMFLPRADVGSFFLLLALKNDGGLDCKVPGERRDEYIAARLRVSHRKVLSLKSRLTRAELIDDDWQPLAWSKRQFLDDDGQSAESRKREKDRQRLQAWRERQREDRPEDETGETQDETQDETHVKRGETQGETVSETHVKQGETASDTDTETETDTEQHTQTTFQLETAACNETQGETQGETPTACVDPADVHEKAADISVAKPEESPDFPYGDPKPAGKLAKLLRELGVQVTPQNPDFCRWIQNGLDAEEVTAAVEIARAAKPKPEPIPWGYISKILTSQRKASRNSGRIPAKKTQTVNAWDDFI